MKTELFTAVAVNGRRQPTSQRHRHSLDRVNFALQSEPMTAVQGTSATLETRLSALAIWLCAFFSPTGYFVLLMLLDRFHAAAPPEILVATLFFLIPLVALLVCGRVVWIANKNRAGRIGWMIFTVLAMLFQFGVLLIIVMTAMSAAIGYAQ
jgi:hypothetical protein